MPIKNVYDMSANSVLGVVTIGAVVHVTVLALSLAECHHRFCHWRTCTVSVSSLELHVCCVFSVYKPRA